MNTDISKYNKALSNSDKIICSLLEQEINKVLGDQESKIWHGHPVWFINDNPIVGYDKMKDCVRLLFWSGQSFNEKGLLAEGSFKAAEARYTSVDQINTTDLSRWLKKSESIQWDYKNIVKRKGQLERLVGNVKRRPGKEKEANVALKKVKSTIQFKANSSARIVVPKGVIEKLPSSDKVIVEGIINYFPFRAVIEDGQLVVSKAIREAAALSSVEKVEVEITRVGDELEVRVPADLRKGLMAYPQSLAGWESVTPMSRRDWILSICTAKQYETRKRRIEKTCDMLAVGKGRLCCFPGINWITRNHVKPQETWIPLPGSKK